MNTLKDGFNKGMKKCNFRKALKKNMEITTSGESIGHYVPTTCPMSYGGEDVFGEMCALAGKEISRLRHCAERDLSEPSGAKKDEPEQIWLF